MYISVSFGKCNAPPPIKIKNIFFTAKRSLSALQAGSTPASPYRHNQEALFWYLSKSG